MYFIKQLKSPRKHSTSFKDLQVLFFKDLKSNFFFGGGVGFGGGEFRLNGIFWILF